MLRPRGVVAFWLARRATGSADLDKTHKSRINPQLPMRGEPPRMMIDSRVAVSVRVRGAPGLEGVASRAGKRPTPTDTVPQISSRSAACGCDRRIPRTFPESTSRRLAARRFTEESEIWCTQVAARFRRAGARALARLRSAEPASRKQRRQHAWDGLRVRPHWKRCQDAPQGGRQPRQNW